LLFILLVLALEDSHAQSFVLTGNMTVPRLAHSATLLPDGRVLIAGGADGNGANDRSTAEIYDPATGTFTQTGAMARPDGTFVATGKYGDADVGNYTLWLYAGGKTSSSVSVAVKNCS